MTLVRRWSAMLGLASIGALAAPPDVPPDGMDAERARALVRLTEQERACQDRFAVAACVDAARKDHRAVLTRLRRQEVALDEAKRREAAALRQQSLHDKAAAQAVRASEPEEDVGRRDRQRVAPKPNLPAAQQSGDAGMRPKTVTGGSAANRRAVEQTNEAKFEARTRAVQAHREAVEQRNAQQAARGKLAAPLPQPAGASAP